VKTRPFIVSGLNVVSIEPSARRSFTSLKLAAGEHFSAVRVHHESADHAVKVRCEARVDLTGGRVEREDVVPRQRCGGPPALNLREVPTGDHRVAGLREVTDRAGLVHDVRRLVVGVRADDLGLRRVEGSSVLKRQCDNTADQSDSGSRSKTT
jgi:hypothetical protein